MQQTSVSYNPFSDIRQVGIGFTFGVVAPDAAETAQASSSLQAVYSQLNQTHNENERLSKKFATLEKDLFLLDGSFSLYPSPDEVKTLQTGWLSEQLSDENGVFAEGDNPWLQFFFSENQSSYGFTVISDEYLPEDYASEIQVTTWNAAGEIIKQDTFYPDNWKYIVDMATTDYRKLRIDFLKTSKPFRRVRIAEVIFGVKYEYDRTNIISSDSKQAVSLWSENLPSSEFTVTIDNSKQLYNMVNPSGLYAYLQEGQTMDWFLEINGEKIPMGARHFTNAKSNDGGLTATITFNDWLLLLDNVKYNHGMTGTWTLAEAITDIISVSGVKVSACFENDIGSVIINKCIPLGISCREAIRLCAQAAKSCCYVGRNNQLYFISPEIGSDAQSVITQDHLYEDAQIRIGDLYNIVKLKSLDSFNKDAEETTYIAGEAGADGIDRVYEVDNPLVRDSSCASWILDMIKKRISYDFTYRGNPAIDLLDTLQVNDVYGVNDKSILIEHNFKYDGGLECDAATAK